MQTDPSSQFQFFERLCSELSPPLPSYDIQKIISSIEPSSFPTYLICRNLTSEETFEGEFLLHNNFLLFYQDEASAIPIVILDVLYASLEIIFHFNEKLDHQICLTKNQTTYEITFPNKVVYDYWIPKLNKMCVLTNFERKYHVSKTADKSLNLSECILETKTGKTHFSARKFSKKYIFAPENSLIMTRLLHEIEILRTLCSNKIIRLNEIYETEDSIYLVTDLISDSKTLKKLLKKQMLDSNPETRSIMCSILKILASMASQGIIHRNIKPSSVIIEDLRNIKMTNFGLATFVNHEKVEFGACGTPGYMAPEILHSRESTRVYDEKVDVFSVGCIFFEMLFGYPLFKGSKPSEVSTANKHFKYSDLLKLVKTERKNESQELGVNLLLKLLHNDPKQRISAEEALCDPYFDSLENSPSKRAGEDHENLALQMTLEWISAETTSSLDVPTIINGLHSEKKVSSNLKDDISEASNSQGSTLYSTNSIRRSSEEDFLKFKNLHSLKNQLKFQSAGEIKLPVISRLNEKSSSETCIQEKAPTNLKFYENNEDNGSIFDESSPVSYKYSRMAKYSNQKF